MVHHLKNRRLCAQSLAMSFFIICSVNSFATASSSPESVPAPGRGVIPALGDHYETQPSFYDFDHMPIDQITSSVGRRFVMRTKSSMVRWDLKAGTRLPVHFHINEQITRVEKGELEVYSQGRKYLVKAGQVMVFPPNVPHEFIAVTDTVIFEQHTPARQDFVNGDFNKWVAAQVPKK